MERPKSKYEQILESLPPPKSEDTLRMKNIIAEVQKEMDEYHLQRSIQVKEAWDDMANTVLNV